jgi:hypothetical protein
MNFPTQRSNRIDIAPILRCIDKSPKVYPITPGQVLEQMERTYLIALIRGIRNTMGQE